MVIRNFTVNVNQSIYEALLQSKEQLSQEAIGRITNFILSQKFDRGGFIDRSGKPDVYYSVFGYTLSLILDVKLSVKDELKFLDRLKEQEEADFIHTVCLVRCYFLLYLIDLKQKSGLKTAWLASVGFAKELVVQSLIKKVKKNCAALLQEVEKYRSKDRGFNHNAINSEKATVYASFLAWTLYQDLNMKQLEPGILQSIKSLQADNGSFANEHNSLDGVTSATAAGLIMSLGKGSEQFEKALNWIKGMNTKQGGFKAATGVPIADLLSTATALLAIKLSGQKMQEYSENSVNFINLHWDESGGFFGSIADMICDVEYTYYALLALGVA